MKVRTKDDLIKLLTEKDDILKVKEKCVNFNAIIGNMKKGKINLMTKIMIDLEASNKRKLNKLLVKVKESDGLAQVADIENKKLK